MIHCVNDFRPYVYGTKFTIVTDHRPLLWFKLADLNAKVQKWRFKLSEYDYDIVHTSGKSNVVAYAISRYPPNTTSVNIITRRQKRLQEAEQNTNKIFNNLLDDNSAEPTEEAEPLNAVINSNEVSKENKKRGRPPKTKKNVQNKSKKQTEKAKRSKSKPAEQDTPPSENKSEESEQETDSENENEKDLINNSQLSGCVITKELLEYRTDHIVYFITSDGEPLVNGARYLLERDKIPKTQEVKVGDISAYRRSNKRYLIGLSLRGSAPIAQNEIMKNLTNSTTTLLLII